MSRLPALLPDTTRLDDERRSILAAVREAPGVAADVAGRSGLPTQIVRDHLRRLGIGGLVYCSRPSFVWACR